VVIDQYLIKNLCETALSLAYILHFSSVQFVLSRWCVIEDIFTVLETCRFLLLSRLQARREALTMFANPLRAAMRKTARKQTADQASHLAMANIHRGLLYFYFSETKRISCSVELTLQ